MVWSTAAIPDLSDMVAVERILAEHPTVDILVNNAGVTGIPERRTEDGFEMQSG